MASWGAVFDWDGVIIDSSAQHEESWRRLAEEEGLELPADSFKRGFGMKNEKIIPELLGWTSDPAEVARLSLKKEALYRRVVQETGIEPLPGVKELLAQLQRVSVPRVIGSSTHRLNVTSILELLGLEEYFDAIVSAEDVSDGKPNPQVFLLSAKRIGMPPHRCVVFEDTPVGIRAGRAAGMKVIAVAATHPVGALLGCDKIVSRLDEINVTELSSWFD
ncbi:MAG: HAD family phosphatase [Acidobacteriota bacterium]